MPIINMGSINVRFLLSDTRLNINIPPTISRGGRSAVSRLMEAGGDGIAAGDGNSTVISGVCHGSRIAITYLLRPFWIIP